MRPPVRLYSGIWQVFSEFSFVQHDEFLDELDPNALTPVGGVDVRFNVSAGRDLSGSE
jgi:hypothetical protein